LESAEFSVLWRGIPDLEKLEDIEDLEEGKGLVNIVLRSNN